MAIDSNYDFEKEIADIDLQSDFVTCPNCKLEVPESVICPKCGYPLSVAEPEQDIPIEIGEVSADVFLSKPDQELTDVSIWIDSSQGAEESDPANQGTAVGSEVEGDIEGGVPKDAERPTSFFSSMKRFMGFKSDSPPRERENSERQILEVVDEEVHLQASEVDEPTLEIDEEPASEIDPLELEESISVEVVEGTEFPDAIEVQEKPDAVEVREIQDVESESIRVDEKYHELREVQEGLVQSISLKLWLVSMLQEGGVEKDQFIRMFDEYEAQASSFIEAREEALERAREVDELEKKLSEARVYLEELKMKREIGRISGGEYEAKAPAYEWEISHCQREISERKDEVEFLEDLTRVIPGEDITRMKAMAESCKWGLNNMEVSGKVDHETVNRVKESLERTLDFLDSFDVYD